jgi:hypothetical protein
MNIFKRVRFLPLAALALAAACSDSTTGPGGDLQVDGLAIVDANNSAVVTVGSEGTVAGSISVPVDGQRALRVVLRAGSVVVNPAFDESVRVTVTNRGVALWQESGTGGGTLTGVSAGSTTLRVDLIRDGTIRYTSPSIPVQVTN